jgi:hypothetical protein
MRTTPVIAVVLATLAIGVGGWNAWRIQDFTAALDRLAAATATATQARSETAQLSGEVAALEQDLQEARASAADAEQTRRSLHRLSRRVNGVANAVSSQRGLAQQAQQLLVPLGADVDRMRVLQAAAGEPRRLVVSWSIGGQSHGTRSGVFVWRSTAAALTAPGPAVAWTLEYATNLQPEADQVTVGSPTSFTVEDSPFGDGAGIADTADVTGDGYADVLVGEFSTGTGGCAHRRVLAAVDGVMRAVFEHEACEATVTLRPGRLRVSQSYRPRGCESIHGCAARIRILRWNGAGWDVVDRRVVDYG